MAHAIPPSRALLYRLLGGDVAGVHEGLQGLDWRRSLAMFLWWAGGPALRGAVGWGGAAAAALTRRSLMATAEQRSAVCCRPSSTPPAPTALSPPSHCARACTLLNPPPPCAPPVRRRRYGQAPTGTIAGALQQYTAAASATPHVPQPLPPYASGAPAAAPGAATDLQYQLLRLYSGAAAAQEPGALAALMRASGHSANPLDCSLGWHAMTVLAALEALPLTGYSGGRPRGRREGALPVLPGGGGADAGSSACISSHLTTSARERRQPAQRSAQPPPLAIPAGDAQPEVFQLAASLLALLDLLPGASHLAVYVAMCMPDAPGEGEGEGEGGGAAPGALRARTVLELLSRYCPDWAGDEARREFLTQRLGVPAAWLHEAAAQVGTAVGQVLGGAGVAGGWGWGGAAAAAPAARHGAATGRRRARRACWCQACAAADGRPAIFPPPPSLQWAGASRDPRRQCAELVAAGAWASAHGVLAQRIAPPLLLQRGPGHEELRALLLQLEPHAADVPSWPSAGGLYLQYLRGVATAAAQPGAGGQEGTDTAAAAAAAVAVLRSAAAVAGAAPASGRALGRAAGLGLMVQDAVALLARAGPAQQRLGLDAPGLTGAVRVHVISRVAGELSRLVAVQQ
jgi:hypothetical protein